MMKKKHTIDLNTILQWASSLFVIFTWYSFYVNGETEYVNLTTVLLGTLLAAEIFIFLTIEKKRRDPFVIILCFQLVFYYVLRILTLSIYGFSVVFKRYNFEAENLNYAIIYIIVANLAIYAGLYINKIKLINFPLKNNYKPTQLGLVFFALIFVYFMTFSASIAASLNVVVGLLTSLFINVLVVICILAVYLIVFYNKLKVHHKVILGGGLLTYIIIATLTGSRAALISTSYLFLIAYLAIFSAVKIKRTFIILIGLAIPVLIFFFTLATFLRARLENRSAVGTETIEVLKEFDITEALNAESELVLAPIFDRIGFLDFAAEIIANEKEYEQIFNYPYYAKSVVDNVLTPGFDVFDTPRTSNALTFIYNHQGTPQKSKVKDLYQSDELTIFGEAYVMLGGWFSIVPLFFIAFLFKKFYISISDKNPFFLFIKRSLIIYAFFTLFNSFGIDWLLLDIIGYFFTYYIFKIFFKFKKDISLT